MKKPLLAGYEVCTCVELPVKDGDTDYDNAVYRRFDCETKKQAITLAMRLLPNDCWGSVEVTEFIREYFDPECPGAGLHKVYTSDTKYVEP